MDVAVSNAPHMLDSAARRLVVNLMSFGNRAYEVRSCEITCDSFRNRTSFQDAVALEDVFTEDVASALAECLGKLNGETEVLSLPNLVVEVPGLTLAGAQILATRTDDDVLHIIIRFRFFVGGINNIFRPQIGFDDAINDHAANLSVRVLTDLALPVLNICEAYKSGQIEKETGLADFALNLGRRSQELQFQVELLKRFVDSTDKVVLEHQNPSVVKLKPVAMDPRQED